MWNCTGRGNAPFIIQGKEEDGRKNFISNLKNIFWSQHSTAVKLLRVTVHHWGCTQGRNFSSKWCQTWQDAVEWCICLMYLQRNKDTITENLLQALFRFNLLPGLPRIEPFQICSIRDCSTYTLELADGFAFMFVGTFEHLLHSDCASCARYFLNFL